MARNAWQEFVYANGLINYFHIDTKFNKNIIQDFPPK